MDHSWIKISYDADEDLLDRDLLVPCLKECVSYRRLTYSFTSATLKAWAGSLHHIVSENVKIEILCDMSSVLIQSHDNQLLIALDNANSNEEKTSAIEEYNEQVLRDAYKFDTESSSKSDRELVRLRSKLLDYLIANNQLNITFAYPKKPEQYHKNYHPLYHYKKGYFVFDDESIVLFKGSGNETFAGYTENYDDFDVFSSKRPGDEERLNKHKIAIDKGWGEKPYRKFRVIGPSQRLLNEIKDRAPTKGEYLDFVKIIEKLEQDEAEAGKTERDDIKAPITEIKSKQKKIFSKEDLYSHQDLVLKDWEENNRRGLVKHATGSGKTFTSIFAIKSHLENNQVCLIIVPSELLQKQWNKELNAILPESEGNILNVGGPYKAWKTDLASWSKPTSSGKPKIIVAIVNTAASDKFRSNLHQGEHLMIVADEVHRLGSKEWSKVLEIQTGPRLGVSATPERYNDPEGTEKILKYFERILEPVYELKDALGTTLVNYEYFIEKCYLNTGESDEWEEMSKEINRLIVMCPEDNNGNKIPSKHVQLLRIFRSKIAKNAEMKIPLTVEILKEYYRYGEQWLVYCDSIHQLDQVKEELVKAGLQTSIYHSELTDKQKQNTLKSFEQQGGILLSIRCLDEGIDIPSITHALIIASDQNPRQFIQRRGRVLRKDRNNPHKLKATIYDLIISVDPKITDHSNSLAITELRRAEEFAKYATNSVLSRRQIRNIARDNGIDIDAIIEDDLSIEEDSEDG